MEEIIVSRNGVQTRYRVVEDEEEFVRSPRTTIHDVPRSFREEIIEEPRSPPRIVEEVRSPPKVIVERSPPRIVEEVRSPPRTIVERSPSRVIEEIEVPLAIDPLIVPKFDSTLFYDARVPPENKIIFYTEMLKQNGPAILFVSEESAVAFALERRFRIVQNVPFSYGNYLQVVKQSGKVFFGTKNRFEFDDPFDLVGNVVIANSGSMFLVLVVLS